MSKSMQQQYDAILKENIQLQSQIKRLTMYDEENKLIRKAFMSLVKQTKRLKAVAEQARNYILYKDGTAKTVTDNINQVLKVKQIITSKPRKAENRNNANIPS